MDFAGMKLAEAVNALSASPAAFKSTDFAASPTAAPRDPRSSQGLDQAEETSIRGHCESGVIERPIATRDDLPPEGGTAGISWCR